MASAFENRLRRTIEMAGTDGQAGPVPVMAIPSVKGVASVATTGPWGPQNVLKARSLGITDIRLALSGDAVGGYCAWPFNNLFFDASAKAGAGQFVQVYTIGASHTADNRRVFCSVRGAGRNDEWEAPIVVADKSATPAGCTSHASVMLANGDYLTCVRTNPAGNGGTNAMEMYRSTDDGATWVAQGQMKIAGANFNNDTQGALFLTASGALLLGSRRLSGAFQVGRLASGANIATGWTVSADLKPTLAGTNPLEMNFFQRSNGTIIGIARATITGSPYSPVRPVWSKSTDDGATWSSLQWIDGMDMSNGNVGVLYDAATDVAELVWSSRAPGVDGGAAIYFGKITGADAEAGLWAKLQITGYLNGTPARDFGYPAIAKATTGESLKIAAWYDQVTADGLNTQIVNAIF